MNLSPIHPERAPARRIARPENIALQPGVWEAVLELPGAPWDAHTSQSVSQALQISPMALADIRYQGRNAPPHEDRATYPRSRGFVFRQDRLISWLNGWRVNGEPLELWRVGKDYVERVFGAEVKDAIELNAVVAQLAQLNLITPIIRPVSWPNFFPYT